MIKFWLSVEVMDPMRLDPGRIAEEGTFMEVELEFPGSREPVKGEWIGLNDEMDFTVVSVTWSSRGPEIHGGRVEADQAYMELLQKAGFVNVTHESDA